MKKVLIGLAAFVLAFANVMAQDGLDARKKAAKAYDDFALQTSETDKLADAVTNIQMAMKGSEAMKEADTYLEAGQIMAALMNQIVIVKTSGIGSMDDLPEVDMPAIAAADAYMKAFELGVNAKKPNKLTKDQKTALAGLQGLQGNLSNAGIFAIQDKQYANSYANFNKSVAVHNFLVEHGEESALSAEGKVNDESYYAAVSALLVEDYDAALPLYNQLKDANYDDAGIYDGLYKVYSAKGEKETAVNMLNEGREKFPDDTQLLFTEINYYLGEKKLDVLIGKLENAIAKEPQNVSLYATLGSVYDNLHQNANKEGDEESAQNYFGLAKEWYEKALEKDADYTSAMYSIGALYFNRGAAMTQELVALGDDFSKEGQKKYEALKAKVDEEFEAALPYFKRAEQMDPSDLNTLVALKEIFARKDQLEVSAEFKDRIETIQNGGTVESYFKGQ